MTDIIIYTTEEKLNHKKGLKEGEDYTYFYWELPKLPKRLGESERIYFATKGFIRGYFLIDNVDTSDGCTIEWDCESWEDIEPISTNSFQGFKYADKVGGLR